MAEQKSWGRGQYKKIYPQQCQGSSYLYTGEAATNKGR